MDDSELDFVDLCSKLLKRNRKKTVDQRQQKTSTQRPNSNINKKDVSTAAVSGTQAAPVPAASAPGPAVSAPGIVRAKDKVLLKMQQFKRDSPQKIVLSDQSQPTDQDKQSQQEFQEGERSDPVDSDEALAMRLQQELDREMCPMDLEDKGLFFCQLCNKDISHMTPQGRTQHINRCLDEKEDHKAPPAPPAGLLECPICGKMFKSQKSRSCHLKRCSSDLGVPPSVLVQALQRQAAETQSTATANTQSGSQKRKASKSNVPVSKKSKKKLADLDEDTMMAMALSSSLLEQDREKQREEQAVNEIIIETTAHSVSKCPTLKWKTNAGKGHGKKKKGGMCRSPPHLLVQDSAVALARIQERVSALFQHSRAPSPPTPTRCPSGLPGWQGTAPLWQKSALLSAFCLTDFYTPELGEFIVPWEATSNTVPSFVSGNNPDATTQPVKVGTPRGSILPSASQTGGSSPAVSTPGAGQLQGCSQALRDLMELAEDGLTLTQYGYSTTEAAKAQESGAHHSTNLPSSGFVVEEEEEQPNNNVSGLSHETLDHTETKQSRTVPKGRGQRENQHWCHVRRLALALGSMVNNPQLSDVQLQVDSGEVYFAHSFMLYTRCPLLAEMVHESGFGVQEEGVPAAQRVLLNDVPGQAVFALLQFLYTAHCSFSSALQPYVLELASRFDLQDLQEFCQRQEKTALQTEEQLPDAQTDEAFTELLRSMWNTEDDGTDPGASDNSHEMHEQPEELRLGDREMQEERVDEDELVEIYEFAATQRKQAESDNEEIVHQDVHEAFPSPNKKDEAKENSDSSLDRSYNRLFSQSCSDLEEKDLVLTGNKPLSQPNRLPLSEMSGRMLLQSSASVIDKMSPSPPPIAQNLPVPGLSPGLPPDVAGGGEMPKSGGVKSQNVKISSRASPRGEGPELVVLSDSSDNMNIDLTQDSNSPSPEGSKSFTGVKEHHGQLSDEAGQGDCSPEVSWLIPSTPVQSGKGVRSSSSQTRSSFCRTRLFPEPDDSPHLPESSADKALSSKPSVSSLETSDRKRSPDVTQDKKLDFSGFAVPQSPSKYSHLASASRSHLNSSKQDTPFSVPTYSSTPVQTETFKLLPDSPLSAEKVVIAQSISGRTSPSPEKVEFQSFHLSPLSERSSSHSKVNCGSYSRKSLSEDGKRSNTEANEVESLGNNDEGEGGVSSFFKESFMDEPPIAFNDSWGLDVCVENPRFSLKLDDSRGSVPKEDIPASPHDGINTLTSPRRTSAAAASSEEMEPDHNDSLMDSKLWDSWEEDDEGKDVAPLSERLKPPVQHKTPISNFRKRQALVPITPMPHYSDMDTPELKNKLNKFGVRPLPKRQMILKLKEIHQYTHQLLTSESEDEAPSAGQSSQAKPSVSSSTAFRSASSKPPAGSPCKLSRDNEPLSASQGSNTSSTAESDRSNPEMVQLSDVDSDSDGGVSASQSASRLQERFQAVRAFILSNSTLYNQILQYKPLVLSHFQQQLKAAGIRLGVTKLADYLDSQCITFTTAKPGQSAPSRRRVRKPRAAGEGGVRRKKATSASH